MGERFRIAIVGSGPAGLSAAAHAAELGLSHVLLEAEPHLSNTIYRYQKGKHVMAEPVVLPLRSPVSFEAGKRETILDAWNRESAKLKVNVRHRAEVTAITGSRGNFQLKLASGAALEAEYVVLSIGLQGNVRKLGAPGEDEDFVQYQLDDPAEYTDETIVVVGAGDAAIENAIALADNGNHVTIVNRRDEFDKAKSGNNTAILKAIEDGRVRCVYNAGVARAETRPGQRPGGLIVLNTANGEMQIPCHRIIARLGATPPRKFVDSCGVQFPSKDATSLPAVSGTYESNVSGLYIIGALAGFPLIKQAMNQGFEVVEYILGIPVEPADEAMLKEKLLRITGVASVDEGMRLLRQQPLLSLLTTLKLREFLLDSEVLVLRPGEVVFRKGDYATSFFSVLGGSVSINIPTRKGQAKSFRLSAGNFFGEMALLSGRRRSGTVLAGEDCVLVETPRRTMLRVLDSEPVLQRKLDEVALRRIVQNSLAGSLTPDELEHLVRDAVQKRYSVGEVIFRQDDEADALYMIRRGSVTVSLRHKGGEVVLAYISAGSFFGEMALVSMIPRTGTVRAAAPTEVVLIEAKRFRAVLDKNAAMRGEIANRYLDNMRSRHRLERGKNSELVSFLMHQGVGEATDVLLIDRSRCIRCNRCELACAETHDGVQRLNRDAGRTFETIHVPASCRHCEHPRCMADCPPDAIHRSVTGEVFIADNCIGCGNCQRNCPYEVIRMASVVAAKRPSLWRLLFPAAPRPSPGGSGDHGRQKAVKCDMCLGLAGGFACVCACPTGAAFRVRPETLISVFEP